VRIERAQFEHALPEDSRTSIQESQNVLRLTHITLVFTPLTFITGFFGLLSSKTKESANINSKQFFPIPKSNGSMSSLDQILALVGGVIVLLAALRRAYRSKLSMDQTSGEVSSRRRSI
jgi:hypothetical protein